MVNKSILQSKIEYIEKALTRIQKTTPHSFEEFMKNEDMQDIILYNLHTAIQSCIDISSHITADQGWETPLSSAGFADVLYENKILPQELSESLRKMIGFRNRVVHGYDKIDFKIVYHIITEELHLVKEFIQAIVIFFKL